MEASRDRYRVSIVGLPEASACAYCGAVDDCTLVGRLGESFVFDPLAPKPRSPRLDPALTRWIASMDERGALIASVCTGSFVLAEAAIPDHQPSTTRWPFENLMRKKLQTIDVQDRRVASEPTC